MLAREVLRLSAEAWAILKALHRAHYTGRAAPTGWYAAYAELIGHGLAEHVGLRCVITPAGHAALRARSLRDGSVGLEHQPRSSIVRLRSADD
jgi:hypothetical protein